MTVATGVNELSTAPEVVHKLVHWLETGEVPAGLFADDVFVDLTVPQWRLQARGRDAVANLRRTSHPAPGCVPRLRYDPTPTGFVIEWEERWDEHGDSWYAREVARADLRGDAIAEMSIYCTGDWSTALVAPHAREVTLLRA